VLPPAQMLLTPPHHPGGVRCCYASLTLDPASLPRRAPALTHVIQLWTTPASEVGSSADMCPMALRGTWVVEIKEGLAAMACSKARMFPRHARALPRHLQDVQADGVIMT
jgi:hypothetical protein